MRRSALLRLAVVAALAGAMTGCGDDDTAAVPTTPAALAATVVPATTTITAAPPSTSTTTPTTVAASSAPAPSTTVPWTQRRVIAIAHAGGEDEAPHSTLYAFQRAADLGVDMLDMDVQLSADGIPVVIHNDTVDATTNATGRVDAMTAAELNALDAAYWFTPTCWACTDKPEAEYVFRGVRSGENPAPAGTSPDDFGVPTLERLFERFPDALMDIEIKGSYPDAVPAADAVAALITAHHREATTVVVSFDDEVLAAFKAAAPDVTTSAGQDAVTEFFVDRTPPAGHAIVDVPPFYEDIPVVTKQFVDDAHAAGLAVWVWMDSGDQESAEFFTKLVIEYGVDGINSARPGLLIETLDALGVRSTAG